LVLPQNTPPGDMQGLDPPSFLIEHLATAIFRGRFLIWAGVRLLCFKTRLEVIRLAGFQPGRPIGNF